MKKVVISANTSWYVYNFRRNTILAFLEHGMDVVVVAPKDEYSHKLISLGCDFFHIDISQRGMNPFVELKTLLQFYSSYRKIKPDIIFNFTPKNNIYSTLAGAILKCKVINNIAGLGSVFIKNDLSSKVLEFLYKISQRKASKIFFQNREDFELFSSKNILPDIRKVDLLPGSGVDLTRFKITKCENDNVVKFLLVARLLWPKGIKEYAEAARFLKNKYADNVKFFLLGFLDEKNPLSVKMEDLDRWQTEGVIEYLGQSDRVEDYIAQSDCVVLPSFYREGVPRSLLEAGAMGKPIVTTNNVGCKETVVDSVNGFICEPRSKLSLITAMEKIISMTYDERCQMGLNSRMKMETDFDEKIIIKKYINEVS